MCGETKANKMKYRKHFYQSRLSSGLPITLVATALLSPPLLAADNDARDDIHQFKKVMVSATRVETDIDDVARPIAVVEKKEIETMQAKSVAEVLRYQPNVTIAGGPRSGQQSVNIRGLSDEKVLQVIDGVRQGFDSGHRPDYFLDPELLKKVEVIKGPVSSLWGSGAIGGVVSQTTIDAGDILKPDQNIGGFVKTGYNNNNDQMTSSTALGGRTDSLDWLLSGYYRDSNDIELGNGDDLENSASRDYGFLAKGDWQINDEQSAGLNYRSAEVNGAVPSNGAAASDSSNFVINRKQETSTITLDYKIDTASPLINAQTSIYWNSIEMGESRVSDNRTDNTDLDVYGLQLTNQSDFNGVTLLYGMDAYREEFDAKRSGADRPVPPKADTTVWGAFAQAHIPLGKAWAIELGARYDDFQTKSDNLNIKKTDSELSPSAALIWQTTEWLKMTLRHDRAFRAPSSEELYTSGTHFCIGGPFGCNDFISNPDLDPEKAANTELLAKMNFNNLLGDDRLQIDASVFENKVDDFIEQVVTSPTVTFGPFGPVFDAGSTTWRNVDEAKIKGYEVAADYRMQELQLRLSYGQVRGEDDKTHQDLSNIPADTFSSDLSYAFMNKQLIAGVRVSHASNQSRTPDTRLYDSYTIGDLYATWQPQSLEGIKVGLTINNVSDKHYRRAFEELHEAGREVLVSMRYSF